MDATWAIVELMGHNIISGRISEENVAGVPMLRVDVPACDGEPAYTKFYSGNAVYGITPTDEATALRAVGRLHVAPVSPYIVAPERQLPPAGPHPTDAEFEEMDAEQREREGEEEEESPF